jgi:hypothetical protein
MQPRPKVILSWGFIVGTPNPTNSSCYAQGLIVVCVLRFLKYYKISSLVILYNFSLNLSLC